MRGRFLTTLVALALVGPATAMEHDRIKGEMDHSDHDGKMIRETTVLGYQWAYHLMDNMAAMAAMDDIQEFNARRMKSHHLMVYVVDRDGKKVRKGKVGYKVTGPDGREQQVMAKAMTAGFGADVDLNVNGTYTVRAKVVVGEETLVDSFTYQVQ